MATLSTAQRDFEGVKRALSAGLVIAGLVVTAVRFIFGA